MMGNYDRKLCSVTLIDKYDPETTKGNYESIIGNTDRYFQDRIRQHTLVEIFPKMFGLKHKPSVW